MQDLYKELIIDHGLNPRNKKIIKNYNFHIPAVNHLCGDMFFLYLKIENKIINEISFEGNGCSISTASASIMTLLIKKKKAEEAIKIFNSLMDLIKNENNQNEIEKELKILSNIKNYPSRVKCCTLIWHALNDILKESDK